jgi:hypothetical protein
MLECRVVGAGWLARSRLRAFDPAIALRDRRLVQALGRPADLVAAQPAK